MKIIISILLTILLFAAPLTVRAAAKAPTFPGQSTVTESSTESTQPEEILPLSEEPIEGAEEIL